jgi:hypothetical protein
MPRTSVDSKRQLQFGAGEIKFRGDGNSHYSCTNKDSKFAIKDTSTSSELGLEGVDRFIIDPNSITLKDIYGIDRFKIDPTNAVMNIDVQCKGKLTSGVVYSDNFRLGNGNVNQQGLFSGTGDGATADVHNVKISSWYGLGFTNTSGDRPGTHIYFDLRSGTIHCKNLVIGNWSIYPPAGGNGLLFKNAAGRRFILTDTGQIATNTWIKNNNEKDHNYWEEAIYGEYSVKVNNFENW